MRRAEVYVQDVRAGYLEETDEKQYRFLYLDEYKGPPVSLVMPISRRVYLFESFPPFFEGLLPEGVLLDALLRSRKIDKRDFFSQLIVVGSDLVGDVTVRGMS
jgi:serine/threonine-protein kinase HipA